VHEVAESTARTLAHLVLAAACLVEVGDWRELGVDRLTVEPAVVQLCLGLFTVLFIAEFNVGITF